MRKFVFLVFSLIFYQICFLPAAMADTKIDVFVKSSSIADVSVNVGVIDIADNFFVENRNRTHLAYAFVGVQKLPVMHFDAVADSAKRQLNKFAIKTEGEVQKLPATGVYL